MKLHKTGKIRIKFPPIFLLSTVVPYTTVIFPPTTLSERDTYCSELYIYIYFPLSFNPHCGKLGKPYFCPTTLYALTAGPLLWGVVGLGPAHRLAHLIPFQSNITDCNRLVFRPCFCYSWHSSFSLVYFYKHSILR